MMITSESGVGSMANLYDVYDLSSTFPINLRHKYCVLLPRYGDVDERPKLLPKEC